MFAQSFSYIASVIKKHFQLVPPKAGERFHFHTERKEEAAALHSALCEGATINFHGKNYHTKAARIGDRKLLFVSSHNTNESFLTQLRNHTASQKKVFEGYALLTIHDTSLDSIIGGSQSLNKDGSPLHIKSFKKILEYDINDLQIHQSEKLALIFKLNTFNTTIHEDSNEILAYFPFMNIIQNGRITNSDWTDLGLFPDNEIKSIHNKNDIHLRIQDNNKIYEQIQFSHKYGDPNEDLVKQFIHAGVKELKESSWEKISYGQVKKWQDDRSKASPPVYLEENTLFPLDGLFYWERAEGATTAAKRKRHIIIFNPDHYDSVVHTLHFDKAIKQAAIQTGKKSKILADQQNKQIRLTIKDCGEQAAIGQVTYDDENASGKYIFNVAVLPFSREVLESHSSTYIVKGLAKRLRFCADDLIVFNDIGVDEKRIVLLEDSQIMLTDKTKAIVVTEGDLDFDTLKFDIYWQGSRIPCELAYDASKPVSISGLKIWKAKREKKKSFKYASENKLVFGNEDYFTNRIRTQQFLDIEKQIIYQFTNYCYWQQDKNEITPQPLDIDTKLLKSFTALSNFYKKNELLPSLTSIEEKEELFVLMEEYVKIFTKILSEIQPGQPLNKKTHNLLKVGTVENIGSQQQICFTPLHPLNVAYQLHIHALLGNEEIPEEILNCFSANDLLPYINGSSEHFDKFCPVLETELQEWTVFRPFRTIHRGWHNEYVHKLIAEKIFEYKSHFPYLFTGSIEAPVKINLINLGNCIDALNGVIRYFQKAIDLEKGDSTKIHPLSIQIHDDQSGLNKFEEFALYSSPDKIAQDFEISLKTKFLDEYDVLRVIREKLDFYIKPTNEGPEYAHLTFFKFAQESVRWTYYDISAVKTGCSLDGLVNSIPSVFAGEEYLTGFGTKYADRRSGGLLDFVSKFNAFARVANTQNPYSLNEATFSTLHANEKEHLNAIYDKSNWVTFIDPKVDLNFFKTNEETKDLIIIHYSDQYNNTSGYDAITVTKKSKQYKAIIHEYLASNGVPADDTDELKLINMFNAINGDWLLRLISSKRGHFSREKISILSAVNTMLAILKHSNIAWVPLSLEEVLRVSGGVGLKQSDGLFSTKNLSSIGTHSDDLLMAGVELCGQALYVHLYPVEVKIGGDQTQKGKEQSIHTANVLKKNLCDNSFKAKFYRNFFAKLIIVAAEKMVLYGLFSEKGMKIITHDCRERLLNDKFSVSWNLRSNIGIAAVLSFKKSNFSRKLHLEQDTLFVEMLEIDGCESMLKSPEELFALYNSKSSTVDGKFLLMNNYVDYIVPINETSEFLNKEITGSVQYASKNVDTEKVEDKFLINETPQYDTAPQKIIDEIENSCIQGMKILFGNNVKTGELVTWEPNNTNKVMHTNTGIIGTMGTGKTQFTKSLVTQLIRESKNNLNSTKIGFLIFDYKGDYIKEDFIQATGATRYDLHRLPFNPLALTVGNTAQPMLPLHTANAIKESIATAFGLGVVQKQKLRDCIMDAYSASGIDKADKLSWTKPAPTIAQVCEEYFNGEDVKNDSLHAALDNLYQFEIFEPDPQRTVSLWTLLDDVVVINLAGYDKDIQNLVVAITLDQFYSQMQKAGHSSIDGNFREMSKMVLVDEADNFLSQDFQAIRKILKEGREFGVGTILSTQFLNHFSTGDNEFANYILTWVAHRVSEINKKDVTTLFGKQPNQMVEQLMTEISGLEKHMSICNIGDGNPLKIHDKAFWQLD